MNLKKNENLPRSGIGESLRLLILLGVGANMC